MKKSEQIYFKNENVLSPLKYEKNCLDYLGQEFLSESPKFEDRNFDRNDMVVHRHIKYINTMGGGSRRGIAGDGRKRAWREWCQSWLIIHITRFQDDY